MSIPNSSATTGLPADLDPFTGAYKGIVTAMVGSTNWLNALQSAGLDTRQIQLKNVRDLTQKPAAKTLPKAVMQPADMPEVDLLQANYQLFTGGNSKAYAFTQDFPLVAVTDTLDVQLVNRVKWFTAAALEGAGRDLGLPYVKTWDIVAAQDGVNTLINGTPANRGNAERWVTMLTIRVQMYVLRTVLSEIA